MAKAARVALLFVVVASCKNPPPGSDASTDAASIPDVDAGTPACVADAGALQPIDVPAFGTFSGPGLNGSFCLGGAFVQMERTPGTFAAPSQILFSAFNKDTASLASIVTIDEPPNATGLSFIASVGALKESPGTYPSTATCGGIAFCVYLPVPSGVDCGDAGSPSTCPAGCELTGPVSQPTCTPIVPEKCWVAHAANDCIDGTQTVTGSWSLALTSVTALPADASVNPYFSVHGELVANMISVDDGTTASLTLGF